MAELTQSPRSARDLAAIALAMVLPSAITWLYFFGAAEMAPSAQRAIFSVVKVVQFALPIVWVLAVQRGRVTLRPTGGQGIAFGLLFGALVAGAMFALYFGVLQGSSMLSAALPEIRGKVAGFGINSAWKFAVMGAFYSLIHSLLEEYYWRWFVFGQLKQWTPVGAAAVISGLGFMAHHILVLGKYFGFASPATYALAACIAVGGIIWALLYHRTGSLIGPWLSHMLVDAAIFAIGYHIVRAMLA